MPNTKELESLVEDPKHCDVEFVTAKALVAIALQLEILTRVLRDVQITVKNK